MALPTDEQDAPDVAPSRRLPRRRFVLLAAAVLALDQVSKLLVTAYLPAGQSLRVLPFLDFTYSVNRGAAFGIWASGGKLLAVVAGLCIIALLVWGARHVGRNAAVGWALACLVGGALGNLLDRIRLGHVIDFIDLRFWPVFNLADVCVVVGAAVLLIQGILAGSSAGRGGPCVCAEDGES